MLGSVTFLLSLDPGPHRLTASAVPLGDQVVLSLHDLGGQRVLFLLVVVNGVRDQVG